MHTLTSSARKFIVIAGYIANHFNNNLKQTRILYTCIFFLYCHLYSFLVSIRDWENMFSASSISIFHIYTPSHLFPGMLDDSEIEKDQIALDNYQNANDDKGELPFKTYTDMVWYLIFSTDAIYPAIAYLPGLNTLLLVWTSPFPNIKT